MTDHPDAKVAAVWDENADRGRKWAGQLGVDFIDDYATLLARSDIDGVVVRSPTDRHRELIVGAAKAGKHEMQGFEADISQADPPASLGDLPLVVLARGRASSAKDFPTPVSQAELDQVDQRWSTLQSELAALSTRSSHRIVKESGHAIPIQGPAAVVEAVRELIDRRI